MISTLHNTCTRTLHRTLHMSTHLSTKCTIRVKASPPRRNGSSASTLWQDVRTACAACALALCMSAGASGEELPRITIAADGRGFVAGGKAFMPWGFNYDHDETGRLIDDYWDKEWPNVERDFHAMRELGANVVRVHLQLGKFMRDRETADAKALERLGKLLELAERERIYLDLTGLGC